MPNTLFSAQNSGVTNSEKSAKSDKLKSTLSELENALTSWNNTDLLDQPADATGIGAVAPRRPASTEIPDDMRRKTRELLDRLKSQIDEL